MDERGRRETRVRDLTLHDSRAQIETVASIVFRMKAPWGFALEQFRARGKWKGAPDTPSADDADLALLAKKTLDEGALWRVTSRQNELDHAAWKFGYVASMTNLIHASRGASMPLVACDMPVELRKGFTTGGDAERASRASLRALDSFRGDRSGADFIRRRRETSDAGLTDDDPMPPDRYDFGRRCITRRPRASRDFYTRRRRASFPCACSAEDRAMPAAKRASSRRVSS